MAKVDIFESSVRSAGDLAGVFEHDGETGYFYLYDQTQEEGRMIVDSILVMSSRPDFEQADVGVRWDEDESIVGLFLSGQLWAVFDTQNQAKHGGGYPSAGRARIPEKLANSLGVDGS